MTGFPLLQLSRPINVLITGLSVFVAALLTGTLEPLHHVFWSCISAMFIAAASNTINDVFDIEIDRINKPDRPLAAGRITLGTARITALIEYAIGVGLASLLSETMFMIAVFFSALTWLYSARLKRTVLLGNLAVSLSTAAAFIYGALAVGRPEAGIVPATFAFLFHLGREIIKDMEDVEGDKANAAHTLPVKYGMAPAIALVWIVFLLLVAATADPYFNGNYSNLYFNIVAIGVYPVLAATMISILFNRSVKNLHNLSTLLKLDMIVGLVALYFR